MELPLLTKLQLELQLIGTSSELAGKLLAGTSVASVGSSCELSAVQEKK